MDDVELRCVSERAASSSGSGRGRARDDRDERRTGSRKTAVAFLLDDGAQHVRLRRDLEVVMVHARAAGGTGGSSRADLYGKSRERY